MRRNRLTLSLPTFFPASRSSFALLSVLCVALSILAWVLVLSAGNETAQTMIRSVVISSAAVLAVNILLLFVRGYGSFSENLAVSEIAVTAFSAVGFTVCGVRLWSAGTKALAGFMTVLINVNVAVFLALLPSVMLCLISWIAAELFCPPA